MYISKACTTREILCAILNLATKLLKQSDSLERHTRVDLSYPEEYHSQNKKSRFVSKVDQKFNQKDGLVLFDFCGPIEGT
jgi:hypothetical protein